MLPDHDGIHKLKVVAFSVPRESPNAMHTPFFPHLLSSLPTYL